MRSTSRRAATLSGLVWLPACFEMSEPYVSTEYQGERVVFGTDATDHVCAGTVAELDRDVIEIEAALELEPRAELIDVWALTREQYDLHCPEGSAGCVTHGIAFTHLSGFDYAVRHELVHVLGVYGKPMFGEGLASALSDNSDHYVPFGSQILPTLDDLLEAGSGQSLGGFGYGYSGDLVHFMLETFGPEAVLAFMSTLDRDTEPDEVRARYFEHFGRELDADFHGAQRKPGDAFSLAHMRCDALPAPPTDDGRGVLLQATLDCDSRRVQNDFDESLERGFVEWTFEVAPEHAGYHELRGTAPDTLAFNRCEPPIGWLQQRSEENPTTYEFELASEEQVLLGPGRYRVRWSGTIDSDAELDVSFGPGCDYQQQDCPTGERCSIWRQCEPIPASVGALGEGCGGMGNSPEGCELGSRCVDGTCVAECDVERPCPEGLGCGRGRVCAPICDLAAQDCGSMKLGCVPGSDPQLGVAGLGVCREAGKATVLDPCDRLGDGDCELGYACEWLMLSSGNQACGGLEAEQGCCAQLCVVDDDDCWSGAVCDPIADGPVGICRYANYDDER